MEAKLNLVQEWDKTFPKSEKVNHSKVTFHNRYGITLAADMYMPILHYSNEIRSAVMVTSWGQGTFLLFW